MLLRILGTVGLVGLSAIASPVLAQGDPPGGDPGAQCFYCDNGAPCQPTQHYDTGSWWFGTLKGDFHSTCTGLSCSTWKGDGHEAYIIDEEKFLAAAAKVVGDGRDEVILRFMLDHPEVRLNVARSALQVATQHGDVYFHARLEPAQTQRLVTALESPSAAAATVRLAPGGPRTRE